MEVKLVQFTPYDILYDIIKVCQDCKNPQSALDNALKSGHLSLLEHLNYTFYITDISRSCSHQLVRHRIASYTQESQRFVPIESEDWYISEFTPEEFPAFHALMLTIEETYNELVNKGIKKEKARQILPNCTKTKIYVTMNARSLDNFFKERMCITAQSEIRHLAIKMYQLVKTYNPYFANTKYPKCKECNNYDCISRI